MNKLLQLFLICFIPVVTSCELLTSSSNSCGTWLGATDDGTPLVLVITETGKHEDRDHRIVFDTEIVLYKRNVLSITGEGREYWKEKEVKFDEIDFKIISNDVMYANVRQNRDDGETVSAKIVFTRK